MDQTSKESRSGSVSIGDDNNYKSNKYDDFPPDYPLPAYSRHYWIAHVQTQEGQDADPILASLLKKFLRPPGESSIQYRE